MTLIDFSSEQKMIQNEVRKFSQTDLQPISDDIDKNGVFPVEVIRKLSDLGFSSLIVPEKYGGAGLDATSLCIVLEELAKVCASVSVILNVNNCLAAFSIMKYGSEQKKDHYLKRLTNGEIGAYVAESSIDLSDKNYEVKEAEGDRAISCRFDFVLNGEAADFTIMPVSVPDGKALYVYEKSSANNLTKHRILGLRAAGIVRFELTDISLSNDTCLVTADKAAPVFRELQDYSSIGFSAISLGIAEAAYDASVKYSKERKQFGRVICEFPMVQEMLVDMKTRIAAARFLVYDAAAKFDEGKEYALNARIARLHSGETAVFSGITAVQVHGGYGYTKDYPVERYLRDAKTIQVLCESPFDLKADIARELLV